jgi:large subunit ribosomal protein L10
MATQKKIETVSELSEKITKSRSIVFADYTGIKHKQMETLRKSLRKVGAEFVVTKNKLLERSLGDNAASVKSLLRENTGTLFSYDDEVAGLKELLKFFKLVALGKTKGGLMGNTAMTDSDVARLSKLPGKQVLLGQLAGQLKSPISGLHYALSWNMNRLVWALNSVKEKKS